MKASMRPSANISRPKVHRLPGMLAAPKKSHFLPLKSLAVGSIVFMVVFTVVRLNGLQSQNAHAEPREPGLSPPITVTALANTTASNYKPILLSDKSDKIVGGIAYLPSQAPTENVKTVASVDKRAARDLLTIVSRY